MEVLEAGSAEELLAPSHIIQIPIFGDEIGVYHDGERFRRYCVVNGHEEPDLTYADASFCTLDCEDHLRFVFVIPSGSPLSRLAHESVHAAWAILEYRGVFVYPENHEMLAYLIEYIFDQLCGIV